MEAKSFSPKNSGSSKPVFDDELKELFVRLLFDFLFTAKNPLGTSKLSELEAANESLNESLFVVLVLILVEGFIKGWLVFAETIDVFLSPFPPSKDIFAY